MFTMYEVLCKLYDAGLEADEIATVIAAIRATPKDEVPQDAAAVEFELKNG